MDKLYTNSEWLYNQYVQEGKSTHFIAKELNVDPTTIYKWVKRFNIPLRDSTHPLFRSSINPLLRKYKNKSWLIKMYFEQSLSADKIAEIVQRESKVKISGSLIIRWMKRFGIKLQKKRYVESLNPNFKGGNRIWDNLHKTWLVKENKKYKFEYRSIVESLIERKLLPTEHVHHINGDRSDNRPENLYLFPNASSHQLYHQTLNQLILNNIFSSNLDLDACSDRLIRKSNIV